VLVYGSLENNEGLEIVKISLTQEKRKELEEEGIEVPSENGESFFDVRGTREFVRKMAERITHQGVIIRSGGSSLPGKGLKKELLRRRGGVSILNKELTFTEAEVSLT